MTDLSSFSEQERALIVSLPYKVGLWISHAEDEEGEDDDAQEMKALKHCVVGIAKAHEQNGFIHALLVEMIRGREDWSQWDDDAFQVVAQIKGVKPALQKHLSEAEYKEFCKVLIEIAIVVAEAHGEFGDWGDEPDESLFSGFMNKMKDRFSGMADSTGASPMNISAAEDDAIKQLKAALKPA